MWTCINCFPDKKSVDLLLLQLFTSFYSHYLPKNKGEIYSTEKIHFLSLVLTFERKLLLVKLQVQRSYLGPLCTWGFFVCSHLHHVSRMNCKVLWGTIACQPVQEFPCPALRALLEPEKPRALLWGAVEHLCGQAALSCQLRELQLSRTSTTTETGCFYSMKLIFGDVVKMPRILGCRAVQSDTWQITLPKPLNSQGFWTNINTFIPDNTFRLKKTFSWGKLQLWIICMASAVYKMNLQ